ncbi:MAG: hemolysin family protein, partial [Candidatus Latescibacterota bacterium]
NLLDTTLPDRCRLLSKVFMGCLFVIVTLLMRNIIPPYRREEGSERPLPVLPIFCLPIYLLLLFPALLLQQAQIMFVNDDDTKARKEEEIRSLVESETEEGMIEEEEREMIEGIFEFRDTTVKEVMIPRIDMISAEITITSEELLELIKESRHSRIPIYEERIDNIKGVVYVKDILLHIDTGKPWIIADIMRTPYFVPENKTLGDLMAEFKHEKVHMAIVVGEYGGTSGLVTMEDIIEEIVGEIQDEYDEEEPLYQWREEGKILIADARLDIEDLNMMFNVELPQDGYETLGGFIYSHLGHVPEPGETLEFNNLLIAIKSVQGQRITQVRIEKREIDTNFQPENVEIA